MATQKSIHDSLLELCPVTEANRSLLKLQDGDNDLIKRAKLNAMKFIRVLKVSPREKRICIEASYEDSPAVVILEKLAFEEEAVGKLVANIGYASFLHL